MNCWALVHFAGHEALLASWVGWVPIIFPHEAANISLQPHSSAITAQLGRKRVSGSVHCKVLFLTSEMPSFMQGLNTGHTDARHRLSDLTFSIPKPFITQHPYPGLKPPSHKANNSVVPFSVLLYVSDCSSPSTYSAASVGFPSTPNLCYPLTATIVYPYPWFSPSKQVHTSLPINSSTL